jgi:acetylornithine deacetylase/succinyl-diaminopimelate desuccinylase-like protein
MIGAVEAIPLHLGPQVVATVGQLECSPNAVNVIAEGARFTIDFRAPTDELLERGDVELHGRLSKISQRRRLVLNINATESLPAIDLSPEVRRRLLQAAKHSGSQLPETISGALHDAAIVAPYLPTGMLFVASRDGISHNPAEFSRVDDVALAAQILYAMVGGDHGAA